MTAGSATALAIERLVTPVAKMHRTISRRWFDAVGPVGKPVRRVHDTVAATVYGSIRLAGSAAGIGIDLAVKSRPALPAKTQAVLNGLWGDQLGRHQRRLEIPMEFRDRRGTAIPIDQLREAFPDAGEHLVVLVHGFGDTERCWLARDTEPGLLQTLQATQLTPLMVRYNSGLPVSANGEILAGLLEQVHDAWPVAVSTISLIGHSMGGLVAGQACAVGAASRHRWVRNATDVITLGSPHRGTPIEKLVSALAHSLGSSRNTEALREFVDTRSQGIKDLRDGSPPVSLPPHIDQHFVAGVVTNDPGHPFGVVLGDFVVRVPSASGGREVDPSKVTVVGGTRHNDLVRNTEVIEHIIGWVQPSQ